ncbi:hypothetical protein ACSBR1_024774 [Camellia fascicularis]
MAAILSSQSSSLSKTNNEKDHKDEEIEKIETIYKSYKEVISTLSKERGWISSHLCQYQCFWFDPMYNLSGLMFIQQHFKSRPTDVLLISLPKSGTTWLKAIVFAIMKRTSYNSMSVAHPLLTTNPHDCVPFLEILFKTPPIADVEHLPSPRLFSSHIPYTLLPESIRNSGCRIVYVCRNPKDVFISMWHFTAKLKTNNLPCSSLSLEEAFDMFCKGISSYGPFWDHVLGYWKASLACPERVLFLNYEDMKRDTLIHVKKLAEFLGQPFSLKEESEGIVQGIVELCSFENLSNLEVNKNGTLSNGIKGNVFFRKGQVGDWKNHLTTQMIERLDEITKENLGGLF